MTEQLCLIKAELAVLLIIIGLMVIKVADIIRDNEKFLAGINVSLLFATAVCFINQEEGTLFGGMFETSKLMFTGKGMLSLSVLVISLFSFDWIKNHPHLTEYYILLLSTLLGMYFMISSGDFLMFYLGLELSTIPLAALCNMDLQKKQSSEAGLKLIMSSAFSSAFLLFGLSLIYGAAGTLDFEDLSGTLSGSYFEVTGMIMVFCGIAFKLSAVPFHLWTADVYEGSPVPVSAFLSVVSKAAVVIFCFKLFYEVFVFFTQEMEYLFLGLSILTITIGNIFAIRQNNIKRLMAFSSISQIGYILFAFTAAEKEAIPSILFFLLIYIFSNLATFGTVSIISSLTGKETISEYRGLSKTNPVYAWVLLIGILSLAGIPPTSGFFGKFFLLKAGASAGHYTTLIIVSLNMVISLYYYLKIVKAMFFENSVEPVRKLLPSLASRVALAICVSGVLIAGLWGEVYSFFAKMINLF